MCGMMDVHTVKETSKRLRISERLCWAIIKDGRLTATYITPFTVRVIEKSIQEFLLSNTGGVIPAQPSGETVDEDVISALIGDADAT